MGKIGWLVMRAGIRWKGFYLMGYVDGDHCWAFTPSKALTFYRREDAEQMVQCYMDEVPVEIVALEDVLNGQG